jgi:NitT/TauT family transport system substrate-binding protein
MSPIFVAQDLLRAEGFTDVQYPPQPTIDAGEKALAAGDLDLMLTYALRVVQRVERGDSLVTLAGVHTGCVELFAGPGLESVRALKGKRIAAGRAATGVRGLVDRGVIKVTPKKVVAGAGDWRILRELRQELKA